MKEMIAITALGAFSLYATSMLADQLSVLGASDAFSVLGAATVTNVFEGNIIAPTSITLDNNTTIGCVNAIALNGAVPMDTNTIGGSCAAEDSTRGLGITISPVPEPATFGMLTMGLIGMLGETRRRFAA